MPRVRIFDREPLLRRLLAMADVVSAVVASATFAMSAAAPSAAAWSLLFVPAWILLAKFFDLYDRDHRALRHLTADEASSLFLWTLTGAAGITVFLHFTPAGDVAGASIILAWATAFAAAVLLPGAARVVWLRVTPPARTVVLGNGPLAGAARRKLALFPDIHVEFVREDDVVTVDVVDLDGVDRVFLASQTLDEARLARLVAACRRTDTRLSVVPPARGMFGTAVHLTHVAELPIVEYNTWRARRSTLLLKLSLDVAVSSLLLVFLAPLLLGIALAIRLTTPGPAIFAQTRAGKCGRPFRMLSSGP